MPQVKKLTIKTVWGAVDMEALIKSPDKRLHCGRYGGKLVQVVSSVQAMPDGSERPQNKLVGEFVGINPDTGEMHRANVMYLPEVCVTSLQVGLAGENVKAVDFLFDVFVNYAPENKGGVKYAFSFEPVVADKAADPVELLLAKATPFKTASGATAGGYLALEAPKDDKGDDKPAKSPRARR